MIRYKNSGGDSGVYAYQLVYNYLLVQFSDGSIYKYSYLKPGKYHVDNMKNLAQSGEGLNSYINKNVKYNYEQKIK